MANYFCTDSVEEQVDYLTDKVTNLNTIKLDKTAIVQASGEGTDVVMSQKAVTDAIATSASSPTAEKLHEVIKGTSTVTVDLSQDQQTLNVAMDKSQEVQYVTLTPSTATQGTLTVTQWNTLQVNKGNCIMLNNEIYRLADNQNVSGLITYVHTGWDGTARKDKSISITVSTKAWTLVVAEGGSGKLYCHSISFNSKNGKPFLMFFSTSKDQVTDKWIYDNLACSQEDPNNLKPKYCITIFATASQVATYGTFGVSRPILKVGSSYWGAIINLKSGNPEVVQLSEAETYTITEF